MLIREILTPLVEMSVTLAEARDRAHNYAPTIISHTLKILLYPNAQPFNKWHGEIYGYITKLTSRKLDVGNKRTPSGTQIVMWINEIVTPEYISKIFKEVIAVYGVPQVQSETIDFNNLWQQMQQAYIAIADKRETVAVSLSKIRI